MYGGKRKTKINRKKSRIHKKKLKQAKKLRRTRRSQRGGTSKGNFERFKNTEKKRIREEERLQRETPTKRSKSDVAGFGFQPDPSPAPAPPAAPAAPAPSTQAAAPATPTQAAAQPPSGLSDVFLAQQPQYSPNRSSTDLTGPAEEKVEHEELIEITKEPLKLTELKRVVELPADNILTNANEGSDIKVSRESPPDISSMPTSTGDAKFALIDDNKMILCEEGRTLTNIEPEEDIERTLANGKKVDVFSLGPVGEFSKRLYDYIKLKSSTMMIYPNLTELLIWSFHSYFSLMNPSTRGLQLELITMEIITTYSQHIYDSLDSIRFQMKLTQGHLKFMIQQIIIYLNKTSTKIKQKLRDVTSGIGKYLDGISSIIIKVTKQIVFTVISNSVLFAFNKFKTYGTMFYDKGKQYMKITLHDALLMNNSLNKIMSEMLNNMIVKILHPEYTYNNDPVQTSQEVSCLLKTGNTLDGETGTVLSQFVGILNRRVRDAMLLGRFAIIAGRRAVTTSAASIAGGNYHFTPLNDLGLSREINRTFKNPDVVLPPSKSICKVLMVQFDNDEHEVPYRIFLQMNGKNLRDNLNKGNIKKILRKNL